MPYTIKQLANLAGVSVRTLHYYDQIELLKPAQIHKNGYRFYGEKELYRLQQILFFREFDLSLREIKSIINSSNFVITEALRSHKKILKLKQQRLNNLIKTINKTINHMTKQQNIKDNELYNAFDDQDVKKYQDEVKKRWGNTTAYTQSMTKVSKMTKAKMAELKKNTDLFNKKLAESMDKDFQSEEVQKLVAEHYQGIQFFYDCPLEMYKNLGQMYVDDPRFTSYYEKYRPGLAAFLRSAINYFCESRIKNR